MYLALRNGLRGFIPDLRARYYSGFSVAAPPFVYETITLFGPAFLNGSTRLADQFVEVLQPQLASQLVWAAPISLATTFGILSFPHGT